MPMTFRLPTSLLLLLLATACGADTSAPDTDGNRAPSSARDRPETPGPSVPPQTSEAGTTPSKSTGTDTQVGAPGSETSGGTIPPPEEKPACTPKCDGFVCGPDGCGGTCGTCPNNTECTEQTTCTCIPGTVPNAEQTECVHCPEGQFPAPDGSRCVREGSACGNIDAYGTCAGDRWIRCDPLNGIRVMDCGPGACRTFDGYGHGACECGNVDQNGVCADDDGRAGRETHFFCSLIGVLQARNCVAETGKTGGMCNTLVTDAGYVTACFCDSCTYFSASSRTCNPVCLNSTCIPADTYTTCF